MLVHAQNQILKILSTDFDFHIDKIGVRTVKITKIYIDKAAMWSTYQIKTPKKAEEPVLLQRATLAENAKNIFNAIAGDDWAKAADIAKQYESPEIKELFFERFGKAILIGNSTNLKDSCVKYIRAVLWGNKEYTQETGRCLQKRFPQIFKP